ncbi:MAG: YdcF family protein [Candidatus Faecousia sp.]|nr:YdcF family protein [Candidatus Faecousia sp.]
MRKTIAQKKALEASVIRSQMQKNGQDWRPKGDNTKAHPILGLGACVPFAAVAYVCKYVLPGYSFTALVCLCIIGILLFYTVMPFVGRLFPQFARITTLVFTLALLCGLALFSFTEYHIIQASAGNLEEEVEYLVVLGAKVRDDGPSVSLWDRIYAAADYLQAHPETIAIVSGGQGEDEPITEAQSMRDELINLGIDESRIWMEDKATSTDENMRFSLDLIEEKTGSRPEKLGILSSEYHLYRSSLMAKKLGIGFVGVPAQTSRLSQLINHAMREVAGVWHFYIFGR